MNITGGLEERYYVQKIGNPDKKIDAIVLEFDDPYARVGILAWAEAIRAAGYEQLFVDVVTKLADYVERDFLASVGIDKPVEADD